MVLSIADIEEIYRTTNDVMVVDNNQKENILFIGSCRIHAFLNYFLIDPNFGNKYNYLCIMVHTKMMQDMSEICIENDRFKDLLKNSVILVCEHLKSFNYFNTVVSCEKNLFQMETHFNYRIVLPNYGMCRTLFVKDIVKYNNDMNVCFSNYKSNHVSLEVFSERLKEVHTKELDQLYKTIQKSIIPELQLFIEENVLRKRIAHTKNHPSNLLLLEMYRLVLKNVFQLPLSDSVVQLNDEYEFLPSTGYSTNLTFYDKICLNIEIDEDVYNECDSDKYLSSSDLFYKP